MSSEDPNAEVRRELEEIRSSATATLMVGLGITMVWLFAYNIISHKKRVHAGANIPSNKVVKHCLPHKEYSCMSKWI